MKHLTLAMLAMFAGAMFVACGGAAPKPEAEVTNTQVSGDCPPCTSPNFDGLPPGGSARAADDLPPDPNAQPSVD